jgi:hypothetical protein
MSDYPNATYTPFDIFTTYLIIQVFQAFTTAFASGPGWWSSSLVDAVELSIMDAVEGVAR